MLLNPERPNPACQRCPTVANRMATMRYWNIARQRHYRSSARCCWTLRVSVDRAVRPSPHTRGKPRLLDAWRRILARDRFAPDSPLEGDGFELPVREHRAMAPSHGFAAASHREAALRGAPA